MLKAPRRKSRIAVIVPADVTVTAPQRKAVPKALREQVWRTHVGESYKAKCCVTWCSNQITPFDYEVGHNVRMPLKGDIPSPSHLQCDGVPHSQGGSFELANLRPICSRCNKSMGDNYTIDQWNALITVPAPSRCCFLPFLCCRAPESVRSDQPSPLTTSASKST